MPTLARYTDWAEEEVTRHEPHEQVRQWVDEWRPTFRALRRPGPYEHLSLVFARCEFLGGLYTGTADTDVAEARSWIDAFMVPVRAGYAALHNLSGRTPNGSEMFSVYRNKALHGYTPAGVLAPGGGDVVGWWIPSRPHLGRHGVSVRISSHSLEADFFRALERFARYLDANVQRNANAMRDNPGAQLDPKHAFRRSFWLRFQPLHHPLAAWTASGVNKGLFPACPP
jgi:hypothetical protein